MEIELAKKLKKAGFDKIYDCAGFYHGEGENRERLPDPSLEELIEAIGEGFHSLTLGEDKNWVAMALFIDTGFIEKDGDTPSGAVANLWLALQEQ